MTSFTLLVFPVVPLLVATRTALFKAEVVGCSCDGNCMVPWSGKIQFMFGNVLESKCSL